MSSWSAPPCGASRAGTVRGARVALPLPVPVYFSWHRQSQPGSAIHPEPGLGLSVSGRRDSPGADSVFNAAPCTSMSKAHGPPWKLHASLGPSIRSATPRGVRDDRHVRCGAHGKSRFCCPGSVKTHGWTGALGPRPCRQSRLRELSRTNMPVKEHPVATSSPRSSSHRSLHAAYGGGTGRPLQSRPAGHVPCSCRMGTLLRCRYGNPETAYT